MSEVTAKRKLTTILAADVVGYSKMMAIDEEATLETLRTYRQVTDGLVEKHNGRIFNTAGDAFLAEFGSAVEAVRCGISIQEDLAVRNAHLSEDRQMWFRIGINVGDVIIENGDLLGDGVNVAARLEGLAEKGGICISGSTFDHVKNKLSIAFDDIGAQNVKNIPEPIPAFRIVPGRVAVTGGETSTTSSKPTPAGGLGRLVAMISIVIAVLLGGAYLAGILPGGHSTHQYDGHWKVDVSKLSGCRDNSPKSYTIYVNGGKIDEPQHLLPKKGSISSGGKLKLITTDRAGNPRNTQVAKISGDAGKGSFEGRKPTCTGEITVVRLD